MISNNAAIHKLGITIRNGGIWLIAYIVFSYLRNALGDKIKLKTS
jgi:hypothetical protein